MSVVEFALWALFGFLFWTRKLHRRFPAMGVYLALHLVAMPFLLFLFYAQARHWFNDYAFDMYFYVYWTVYIASAVLLFFVCIEVFRSALSAFSGLQKLGTVAFRWAALVSVVVSLSTLSFESLQVVVVTSVASGLMRSVSILELCLLGFLCLSMNALRLSARNIAFGFALGFGLMSTNDLVVGALLTKNMSLTGPLQFVYESLILVTLGIWVTYCALPEPARKPVLLPAASFLFRWNEIATALGHTGTQVAVPQQDGAFFLTDAEQTAEKVIVRNQKNRESAPVKALESQTASVL
jgi:hypothetical protein